MSTQANHGATANNSLTHPDEEHAPLLSNKPKHRNSHPLTSYLDANLRRQQADLILLFSYITTGLLDSTATAVWGSFASMQTGNTIYLGLGLSNPTASTRWIKSVTAISCFCFGSYCFARFHRMFKPRRRWVLMVSALVQLVFVIVAAVIITVTPKVEPDNQNDLLWYVLVPLGLVAFQSAGQAVESRALEYNALTSVVLTSIYCDLFSDAKLFADLTANVERNRRAAAPVLLLIGAILGGLWSKMETGTMGAMWMVAGFKGVVLVAWGVWPVEKEEEEEEDEN